MKLTNLVVLLAVSLPLTASAETHTAKTVHKRVPVTKVKSFDYGRLYVHTDERQELQRVAQLWRQRPAWWTVTVEGHGYVANDEEASIELGEKRAERVRDLLVKFGVDRRFIVTIGHSRAEPGRFVDVLVDTCATCER
jgi:outer membrane protein OmpA-like peptidoglycan-associated protein